MALTGWPDEPLGPPEGLVEGIDLLAKPFPGLDALALLGERAALMGLWRQGDTSCGGSCRLFRCAKGFIAVSLPRDEDMEMVPAWLELDMVPTSAPATWSTIAAKLTNADPHILIERAGLLGLPVARVGESAQFEARAPVLESRLGDAPSRRNVRGLVVIDLSALWAGPLCGDLLAGAGATVVKVESTQRPDGARRGTREFFDRLNGQKRSVAVDLQSHQGIRILRALVKKADIVIEASRPAPCRSSAWTPATSSPRTAAHRSGSRSPATAAAARTRTAWRSATTLPQPVVSSCGKTTFRSSAVTPSPTRSQV